MAADLANAATPDSRSQAPKTAADVMSPGPRTCSAFSSATEAAILLRDEGCGALPVVDDRGRPEGILTDRDIALALGAHPDLASRPVAQIMSRAVVTAAPEDPIDRLPAKLIEAPSHRILVVNPDGSLRGIVSWSDLLPHLNESEAARFCDALAERPAPDGGARQARRPPRGPTPPLQDAGPWDWMRPASFRRILQATVHEWSEDKVPRLGAALAFYSLLSLAPLTLIAVAVAGFVFGEAAAQGHVVSQMRGLVGQQGAEAVQEMLAHAHRPGAGVVATLIGVATLLIGAGGVFGALQDALNTIWEVQPKPGRGWLGIIKDRFLSFAMVLGTGFLLLVSLLLSAALAAVFHGIESLAPGAGILLRVANTVLSFALISVLFALIFKVLPDVEISWRDVWVGAVLTTILFLIGKGLIGLYLGRSSYGSAYGAAGSLVVLVVWVYYSALILFFGAEFTQVYANHYGSRIKPSPGAEPVTEEARAKQGIPRTEPT
jgi:membrane protein